MQQRTNQKCCVALTLSPLTEKPNLTLNDTNMDNEKGTQNSRFGSTCLFLTGVTLFTHGFQMTALGPVIPALNQMYNETYFSRNAKPLTESLWLALLTVTVSMIIVGAFVGGITIKFFLSMLSRKHLMQMYHVVNIFGAILKALVGGITKSYEVIIIGRFIVGFAIGAGYTLTPLMMAEMSEPSKRASWQSFTAVLLTLGGLCGPSLAHPKVLGNIHRWPILLAIGAIPSVVYLISSIWIPESPYYLVRENKHEEAMQALRKLRKGSDTDLKRELCDIDKEVNATTTIVGIKEMLTTKQYRNQLIAVCAIYAGFQLSGANNFVFYTDLVFLQAGIAQENVTYCTIGVFFLQFIASIFGTFFVKRFGGLKVNIGATVLIIISLTIFTISQATFHLAPNVMPIIAIISTALFFVSFFGGFNMTTLVLLGDITIEPTRTTAFGYGACVLWIMAWFVGFIPPYLQISLGVYSMTIWLGCTILYLIFQLVYLPDTKGKTPDEIQAHFK